MGSKYRTHHSIPETFPKILKDFVREILREQPANVYEFGASYFKAKSREQSTSVGIAGMSGKEIEEYLFQIFHANATDGSGTLSKHDFKQLLESADLGLSHKQIKLLYAEADQDDDGVINYQEFISGAVTLLQAMAAREEARAAVAEADAEAEDMAYQHLVHGLTSEEVASALEDAWFEADTDGSGYLDKKEITKFLKNLPLNLTRKERNIIMAEIEFDDKGEISRDTFLNLAHAVMLEVVKQEFFNVGFQGTELENHLMQMLHDIDTSGDGMVKADEVRHALKESDFGLSKFQLYTIVSEAPMRGKYVIVDQFVPIAARMIQQMVNPDPEDAAKRQAALESMQDEAPTVAGMAMGELQQRLMEFFRSYDADSSGFLETAEFEQAITSGTSGTGIDFTPEQAQLLLAAADEDGDGRISYTEFMQVAMQLLEYHDRESRIREFHQANA
mmetsp:Transcript_13960/g.32520  ORF Transcript_13960/g.32520 Transcript_13960/m.32520 type:complete len:447 (+) Transcript_13960:32-1372(+)